MLKEDWPWRNASAPATSPSTASIFGYKESGIGRVGGPEGLEGYQEIKTVYLPA
jgi:acyl-CoA reductase-like NAD-dependent aldehyde dehydrogenase